MDYLLVDQKVALVDYLLVCNCLPTGWCPLNDRFPIVIEMVT